MIPAVPPVRVIPSRYIDADVRSCPERMEAALVIAKAYHDDWQHGFVEPHLFMEHPDKPDCKACTRILEERGLENK